MAFAAFVAYFDPYYVLVTVPVLSQGKGKKEFPWVVRRFPPLPERVDYILFPRMMRPNDELDGFFGAFFFHLLFFLFNFLFRRMPEVQMYLVGE